MENYQYVISTGYCALQNLLKYRDPIAYTDGIYGWNCDIYEIEQTTVITSGYAPFGNIQPDYELVRQYEKKAEKYISEHRFDNPSKVIKYLDKLLRKLVDKIVMEYWEKTHDIK